MAEKQKLITLSNLSAYDTKIKALIDAKQVKLSGSTYVSVAADGTVSIPSTVIDSALTDNSSNLVTSGVVKSAIDSAVASAYVYKGSVATAALPTTGQKKGDVYNLTDAGTYGPIGTNVAWDGNAWDSLAGTVDLSTYQTTATADGKYVTTVKAGTADGTVAYTINDVDSADVVIAGVEKTTNKKATIAASATSTEATDYPTISAVRSFVSSAKSGVTISDNITTGTNIEKIAKFNIKTGDEGTGTDYIINQKKTVATAVKTTGTEIATVQYGDETAVSIKESNVSVNATGDTDKTDAITVNATNAHQLDIAYATETDINALFA